jgi:hypothetical protein
VQAVNLFVWPLLQSLIGGRVLRDEAETGATVLAERAVLVVVRTLTSLDRLKDVVPLFDSDPRIMVKFVLDEGSKFTAGFNAQLNDRGIPLISWAEARQTRFDLMLAAHTNRSLAELNGPLVVVPHGAGYNRLLPARTGGDVAPVGLSRHELTSDGEVFPSVIGLSHERQLEQLRRSCPEALDRAAVIGDPTWDRIVASRPRRDSYRRSLGVSPYQRLVVVSSTWDVNSLLGQRDRLVERLVAQLPMDEFRVALVLHPNVWAHHGISTVQAWFRDSLDSGLTVISPHDSWQAALVAADVVVGDHGSVSFYGAALGHPFLHSGNGLDDVTEDSTAATFVKSAERIDPDGDLRAQIESCFLTHDPSYLSAITDQALGHQGESWSILHRVLYDLMAMEPPGPTPRMLPLDAPQPLQGNDVTAFHVSTSIREVSRDSARVQLERFPAVLGQFRRSTDTEEYFLVVDSAETDLRLRESAEVIVRSTPLPGTEASVWTRKALAESAGAALAVVTTDDHCLVVLRNGDVLRIFPSPRAGSSPQVTDSLAWASAVYSWLVTGRSIHDELVFELHLQGSTTARITTRRLGTPTG